jgi:hypothetical protein
MASRLTLIAHDHAAKAVEPSKGAFQYPMFGYRHKPADSCWQTARELVLPAQGLHLLRKNPFISFVRQYPM